MIRSCVVGLGLVAMLASCDKPSSEQNLAAEKEQADVNTCLSSVYAQSKFPEKAEQIGIPEVTSTPYSRKISGQVKLKGADGTVVPYLYTCAVVNGVAVNTVVMPG